MRPLKPEAGGLPWWNSNVHRTQFFRIRIKKTPVLSDVQKQEMRRVADRITPKSWNVVLRPEDEIKAPGILNILISIQKPESEVSQIISGINATRVKAGMVSDILKTDRVTFFLKNQIKPALGMVSGRMVF